MEATRTAVVEAMGPAAMVGSYYGARLTGRVSLDRLIMTMAVVLLAVGVLLIAQPFIGAD